jgi:hypothetical protein
LIKNTQIYKIRVQIYENFYIYSYILFFNTLKQFHYKKNANIIERKIIVTRRGPSAGKKKKGGKRTEKRYKIHIPYGKFGKNTLALLFWDFLGSPRCIALGFTL